MDKMLSITVPGNSINELLQHWASSLDWDTAAFVSVGSNGQTRSINRRELLDYAGRFAYKLSQLGVTKGSIVCSTLPNSIERVICDMGIYLSGATSMNGQIFRSDGQDVLSALKISKAQYVIVDPRVDKLPYQILKREGVEIHEGCVKCHSLPDLCKVIFCTRNHEDLCQDFLSSLQNPKLNQLCIKVDPSDLATILTTSGSTGYSKLVKLTHANLCHFCVQVKAIEPLKVGDRFINCAPLGWAGGFPQWYLGCGATRYFMDMYDGPPENLLYTIWRTIVKERIIYGFLSPMYVNEILHNSEWWADSEWKPKTLCLAGQPIKKVHLDIIGKLCSAVDINYGMTECNLVATHRVTDSESFKDGCAGYPGHGVSLKVVDQDRNELPQGTTGEILLKSQSLTSGYLNNEAANSAAFTSDGWLCTDDAGYVDSQGRVHVEGRQSDSILRGAYILYPSWLEQEIKKLDTVKDVVVVAVPDPVLHNEICACIVAHGVAKKNDSELPIESSSSFIEREYEKKCNNNEKSNKKASDKTQLSIDHPSTSVPQEQLEQIRLSGMKKSLKTNYNITKVKSEDNFNLCVTSNTKGTENRSKEDSFLKELEIEIRLFCDQSQVLAENDAMRMIPKYYVFWDQFPVSATGKLNRKKICDQVSVALDLQ